MLTDDLEEKLQKELQQERRQRYTLSWSVSELDRTARELERQIAEVDEKELAGGTPNEWKLRFNTQRDVNDQLEKQKEWLSSEVQRHQNMLREGMIAQLHKEVLDGKQPPRRRDVKLGIGVMMNKHYVDLDRYTERELARLEVQMERQRNHLVSALKDTEWNLDRKAMDYNHLEEIRQSYRTQNHQLALQVAKLRQGHDSSMTTGTDSKTKSSTRITPTATSSRSLESIHLSQGLSPSPASVGPPKQAEEKRKKKLPQVKRMTEARNSAWYKTM